MKQCLRCKDSKPISEFDKAKLYPDGLRVYCKQCRRLLQNQRYAMLNTKPKFEFVDD